MRRITIDFDDTTAAALDQWLASTAGAVGGQLEAADAIAAMIRVTMRYTDITDTVASQIRHQRTAPRGAG